MVVTRRGKPQGYRLKSNNRMNDNSRINNDLVFDLMVMWYGFFSSAAHPGEL